MPHARPLVSTTLGLTACVVAAVGHAATLDATLAWREIVLPTARPGGAVVDYGVVPRLVTATGAGTPGVNAFSPVPSGGPAYGVDTSGVARLFLDTNPAAGFGSLCTASLLPTGRHLLTAAHCVTDDNGQINVLDNLDGNAATFFFTGGAGSIGFSAANITVHPDWNGNVTDGFDVAIIDLGVELLPSIARYDLFTNTDGSDFDVPVVKIGFGRSGDGTTGATIAPGTQRAGLNRYESNAFAFLGHTNTSTQLLFDFDSGNAANDAYGSFFGLGGTITQNALFNDAVGFGLDEVGTAPGDSGGPGFIFNPLTNRFEIAGVTSYGFGFTFDPDGPGGLSPTNPDLLAGLNSSFGEFAGDARVADPTIQGFILATIPEPASAALLTGVALLAGRRQRQIS